MRLAPQRQAAGAALTFRRSGAMMALGSAQDRGSEAMSAVERRDKSSKSDSAAARASAP